MADHNEDDLQDVSGVASDILSLSDEQIANMVITANPEQEVAGGNQGAEVVPPVVNEQEDEGFDETDDERAEREALEAEEAERVQAEADAKAKEAGNDGEAVVDAEAAANGKAAVVDAGAKADGEAVKADSTAIDYKAEYEKLTGSFKANGKDMQVGNVDEALTMMKMGANYVKKMTALKPSLKVLKMLETNGLLDEDRLNFLIDIHKNDPAAINKLIADSKIDPLDLSSDKADSYKPGNHSVSDSEMALDEVLQELQGSEHLPRTLELVSRVWDKASKDHVIDQPQIMKVIEGHMSNGIYDIISTRVERERILGRLNNVSDLEAYRQVGDAIQAEGGFNHLNPAVKSATQVQSTPAAGTVIKPPAPKVDAAKLNEQRRAAGVTKAGGQGKTVYAADFNPLALSDEDFAKIAP